MYPAKVPGTVHTDLLYNKLIPDPFYGSNEKELQWIEECNWEYLCKFDCSEEIIQKKNIELVFEGLDTYAKVYLNDSLIISAFNMFRIWKSDVRKLLKSRNNKLYLVFESAVNKGIEAAGKLPYTLPGGEKVYTRKAAYQYGWDWGPRFVTCGIWKPVKIEAWNYFRINNVQVTTESIKMDSSLADISTTLEIISDDESEFIISITDKANGKILCTNSAHIRTGVNEISCNFRIEDAMLWWCNGSGRPCLYNFLIEATNSGHITKIKEIQTGLRTIELVQDDGQFYFKLNGIPVFIKGANIIPPDNFLTRLTHEKYLELVNNAANVYMNMLRIWGGGVYADDRFLDYCDEKGILIWHDFMFACSMYPGDSAFTENVWQEAIENIIRMRNHPCLALWCGNNEIDEGWNNWGWQRQYRYSKQDSAKIWSNYLTIFHKILPEAVETYDPHHTYISTSPKIGWGHEESLLSGDCHYWGVWWGMEPFDVYQEKTGHFMSEYGFQGFPDIETLRECMKPEDIRLNFDEKNQPLTSDAMKTHQKHPTGYQTIQTYMEREYNIPKDFESYIYISQLLQAYGIKKAIDAHRDDEGWCMGTLYWQFNDCWPVVSWSGIDCNGRWKALHYFVKKSYQDTLLKINYINSSLLPGCGTIEVDFKNMWPKLWNSEHSEYAYNEASEKGRIKYLLVDFDGNIIYQNTNENCPFGTKFDFRDKWPEIPLDHVVLNAKYYYSGRLVTESNLYFVPPKDLILPKVEVQYNIKKHMSGYSIELYCNKLAKNVYLSVDDNDAFFSDNYFDLMPGDQVIVHCKSRIEEVKFRNSFKIKSLVDCY
jgi:beta-mannosidase